MLGNEIRLIRERGIKSYFKDRLLENRSVLQILYKNTIWTLGGEFVNKGLIFLLGIIVARAYGVTEYGYFTFAVSFTGFFALLLDLGFSMLAQRDIAKDRLVMQRYVENILAIKVVATGVMFVLIFAALKIMGKQDIINLMILLVAVNYVMETLGDFFRYVFRGLEAMEYVAITKVVRGISIFALGLFFALNHYPITSIAVAYIIGATIAMIVALKIYGRMGKLRISWDLSSWKTIIRESLPFALSNFFVTIYFYLDSVLLGIMQTATVVGYYNAAYNILIAFFLLQGIIYNNVFFPTMARLYSTEYRVFVKIVKRLIWAGLAVSGVAVILVLFGAPYIINLVYGAEFMPSVNPLMILIICLIFTSVSGVFGQLVLNVSGRQIDFMKGVGIGALINIILNLFLIPTYSMIGAAIATVITELFVMIYMTYKSIKFISAGYD